MIVEGILAQGHRAIIATSSGAVATSEWQLHLGQLSSKVQVLKSEGNSPESIARLAANARIDHVVVPSGDAAAVQLGMRRKWRARATITLLIMRDKPQPS